METQPDTVGRTERALELHRKTLRLVPLFGKVAFLKNWPELHLSESDLRSWSRQSVNWGIITGDPLVVLDTDTEAAEAWVKMKNIDSSVMVRTGGGGLHRYFRSPELLEIRSRSAAHGVPGLDVKAWRSYVVAPGSIHPMTNRRYEFVAGRELGEIHALPFFDPAWVRDVRVPSRSTVTFSPSSGSIRNVRGYIRRILSIEGQGGDRACFTVACLLVEAGLSIDEIVAELELWNQECALPLWSSRELDRKARCAWERVLGRANAPLSSP